MKEAVLKEMICIVVVLLVITPINMANGLREHGASAESMVIHNLGIDGCYEGKGVNMPSLRHVVTNGNLVPNPSFEEGTTTPAGWEFWDYGDGVEYTWDTSHAFGGEKSVGIGNISATHRNYCWITSEYIPIDPLNHSYILSTWYKYLGTPKTWQWGLLGIEGYDENGEWLFGFGVTLSVYYGWHYFEWDVSHSTYFDERARWVKILLEYTAAGNSFSNAEIRFDDIYFGESQYQPPVTGCTVTPLPDGENGWYIQEATITVQLDATDQREGVEATFYSVNDGGWEQYTQPFTIAGEEGLNKISYYSIDKAGNEEEPKSTFIRVDKTGPYFESITPKHGFYFNDKLIVSLSFCTIVIGKIHAEVQLKDEVSGPWKVEFHVDGELKEMVENQPYTWLWKEKTPGKHTLKVVGYDMAGHNITEEIKTWIFNTPKQVVDQQQTEYCGLGYGIWRSTNLAQSFIPSLDTITRVELYMSKKGNPESLKISIRSSLDGEDLTSVTIDGSVVSTNREWIEFDFPDITITPHQTYYIVWTPTGSDSNNVFFWGFGDHDPYPDGCAWKCRDGYWYIFTYENHPEPDFCFQTYGK